MADRIDDLQGLHPRERGRLAEFGLAFERVGAGQYPLFTEVAPSAEVDAAQQRALALIDGEARKRAIRAAVNTFVEYGSQAYSRRLSLPDTFLLYESLPDRAEDRVRFLATIERAVVAMILWDELDPDDRAALLGPWGAFVEG